MNQKRTKKICFSFCWAVVSMGLILSLFSVAAASESQQSVDGDELLAASLSDLRATMEKARQSNASYSQQNRLLRQQIDQIQEAINYFETQKVVAGQDGVESVAGPDLEGALADQEKALYEARVENFMLRRERFKNEGLRLQKKIQSYDEENQIAQQNMAQLAKEIAQMESGLKDQSPSAKTQEQISADVSGDISDYITRRGILEKNLALQREILQNNDQQKAVLEKQQASLLAEISSNQEQLTLLQGEKKLIIGEVEAAGSDLNQGQNNDRQAVVQLQDYRNQLNASIANLKKTARMVSEKDNRNLEYVLKNLKQQQVFLKQKLSILESRAIRPVQSAKAANALVISRKRLLEIQKDLQTKIKHAQKEYAADKQSITQGGGVNVVELNDKIDKSSKQVRHLQQQINELQRTPSADSKSQELAAQVETLEKNLQLLRRQSKDIAAADDVVTISQDDGALEEEIKSLTARRDILSESISAIDNKYQRSNLFPKGFGATEEQLKEYRSTLSSTNAALQEKLLVLQMRQDKLESAGVTGLQ
ncbi:MAG: hypothetical protein H6753_01980 [Candidatus Omnitrophica bacterium]|nr:hypothetical protein [Candidatus Omnitrophota bacterium]